MRIVLITQNAPVYLPFFLEEFFRLALPKHDILFAAVLPSVADKTFIREVVERLGFYGPKAFIQMSCYILCLKLLSLIPGLLLTTSVNNVLKRYSIDHAFIDSINDKTFIDRLDELKADIVISVASPEIFNRDILSAPTIGCINYHTGLLPKYRGRQPLFWALLNDEHHIGITIHFMNEKVDDGPIICQERVTVAKNESLHNLYKKTIRIGPVVLAKALEILNTQGYCLLPNDISEGNYFGFPRKKDSLLFRKKNKRFF